MASNAIHSYRLTPGTILNNIYRIEKKIGQGGMAIVYEATDLKQNQTVAIKQIIHQFFLEKRNYNEEYIERLKREYNILNNLKHPNLIRVFDFFEQEEQVFLVMEILQGISLQDFFKQHPEPLPLAEQLTIAYHLSNAIFALNQSGIIHRDIKPANVMLIPSDNRVILLDLGLAKSLQQPMHDITATGSIVGTPEYLSPEQINGETSPQSDIFSLGVTLYQLFSWQIYSPFKSRTPMNTMTNVLIQTLPPFLQNIKRKINPTERLIFQRLQLLIDKALEKIPENRLANSFLICEELKNLYTMLSKQSIEDQIFHLEKQFQSFEETPQRGLIRQQFVPSTFLEQFRCQFYQQPLAIRLCLISIFSILFILIVLIVLLKII